MGRFELTSQRFGTLEFEEEELLHFPGLPGFPEAKRFLVREHDRETPLAWLICADAPELAFVVVDPWLFAPDYRPVFESHDWEGLGVSQQDALQVLVIAQPDEHGVTLNLAAPLLIGVEKRLGRQAILTDTRYPTRHRVAWRALQTESKPQR